MVVKSKELKFFNLNTQICFRKTLTVIEVYENILLNLIQIPEIKQYFVERRRWPVSQRERNYTILATY